MTRGIIAISILPAVSASAPVKTEIVVTCSNAETVYAESDSPNADLEGAAREVVRKECPVGYDILGRDVQTDGRKLGLSFVCRTKVAESEPVKSCSGKRANVRAS
jgi:hypothetical protein